MRYPLAESIAGHNCILFLGPDSSESAAGYRGIPTSWQLADELAAAAGYKGPYLPLPRIAQVYESRFGRVELVTFLRTRLLNSEYVPLPLHAVIAHLRFPYIIHAGWDGLLEQALEQQGVPYQRVQDARDLALVRDGTTVIYRPYGSLESPSDGNLVITQKEQFDLFERAQVMVGELRHVLARYSLLLAGYALDDDAVFMRIYHTVRSQQGEYKPPAFTVLSVQRPDSTAYWETLGITPVVADPAEFLYELAEDVARRQGRSLDLPAPRQLSAATPVDQDDLKRHIALISDFMARLGIGPLIEQTDVPLLNPEQLYNLEAMRSAYQRLAERLKDPSSAAGVYLRQGNVEYVRGNFAEAEAHYKRAIQIDPCLAEAYYNLHYTYLAQHHAIVAAREDTTRLQEAWSAYAEAIRLDPSLNCLPDRYQLNGVLGQGTTGIVYRGVDTRSGQTVAVKVLKRAVLYNRQATERFRTEAGLLQRLDHPNIVKVVESGEYRGVAYLAMEYLGESTLATRQRAQGPISFDDAVWVVEQVAGALSAAHAASIVHGNVKPGNIFLLGRTVKVMDFSLATETIPAAAPPHSATQAVLAYSYLAPEQRTGGPVDGRADQYALATVAYELIARRHPDQGVYAPVSELANGVSVALDFVLDRARQPDPANRFDSMQVFESAFASTSQAQPASRHAPAWVRAMSCTEAVIEAIFDRYWIWLLVASLALLLQPGYRVPGASGWFVALRCAGFVLGVATVCVVLCRLLLFSQARRSGFGLLAAYASLWGLCIGLAVGIGIMGRELLFEDPVLLKQSTTWLTLVIDWLAFAIVGSFFVLIAASGAALGTAIARRWRRSLHWGPAVGLVFTVVALAGLYLLLRESL